MHTKEYTIEIGGKTIIAEFSNLAEQANGSVILKCEDTVVLATAVLSKDGKGNPGFFNLTVDYLEKFYAAGLILGGQYNKREGKPSDEAILSSRIVDRTIRPLFDQHIKNAVQVIITVLSVGGADPGVLAINAASLALGVSDIPWNGPIGAVHIGKLKGDPVLSYDSYVAHNGETGYDLDLTICGKDGKIVMIEALAFEEKEADLGQAFDFAVTHITKLEEWQKKIISEIGKPKQAIVKPEVPDTLAEAFHEKIGTLLNEKIFSIDGKKNIQELETLWKNYLIETYPEDEALRTIGEDLFENEVDKVVHDGATKHAMRADGRAMNEVRALHAYAGGISSVLHGSGIFYRGETHVLSILTLGGPADVYQLEGMEVRGAKRFMHHYNFPPYSSGETGRVGGLNRREMGHGMLAEKALVPVIPKKEIFPYTIRIVSESMASNGSTSQASICASTLALMDGGVPIKAPVAGIAMGLMIDYDNPSHYKILTDIQGPEDHYGDMDFKVAGTREGVTALQLDIKVGGIAPAILKEALIEARVAREKIISVIETALPAPRKDISPNAPKIILVKIRQDQIGLVIGGGGKTITMIREKTGAEITIEDDGTVYITGKNGSAEEAKKIIETMTHEWAVGEITQGTIIKILEIGAVVALSQYADGLVHISEIAPFRVQKVSDVLKEGERVPVKVIAVDKERDRISLSIKEADRHFIKNPYPPKEPAKHDE
jgi:polyribonucleotide nucleotidyltransferase